MLLLTKAIGTGVVSTALKKERVAAEALAGATASMMRLNRDAAEALHEIERDDAGATGESEIHAVTDVTGFGLLGHAREMAIGNSGGRGDAVSFEIDYRQIQYLPGALEAARGGFLPGGLKNNREFVGDCVGFAKDVPQEFRDLLFDPQTSGGLLVAIAGDAANRALATFAQRGVEARAIGRVVAKRSPLIFVN
jgi:selenide,water dikinase